MATKAERQAEAMRKHVEFCQERTRQNEAKRIAALEAEYAKQQAKAQAAEEHAQQLRAQFRSI